MAKTHEPTDDELLEFMRPSSRQTFENPESAPRDTARIRQGAKRLWRAAQKSATDSSQSPPRTPPKKYRPSPEQIKQLCRSLNLSEAQAWAFLESETRDAKDMLAYLEYEGGQVPPDDSPGEGEFRDIQPSQISPDKKPPGEFDDIQPIGTFDTAEDDTPAKPDWTQTRKPGKRSGGSPFSNESAEERALRRQEEVVNRWEELQRRREREQFRRDLENRHNPGSSPPVGEVRSIEPPSHEPTPPAHRVSRVLAGGLFALFFGALIQALTVFGVITMNSGHVFMIIALVAGALLLTTEILPVKPRSHKILSVVILGLVLLVIDVASAFYAARREQKPQAPQTEALTPLASPTALPTNITQPSPSPSQILARSSSPIVPGVNAPSIPESPCGLGKLSFTQEYFVPKSPNDDFPYGVRATIRLRCDAAQGCRIRVFSEGSPDVVYATENGHRADSGADRSGAMYQLLFRPKEPGEHEITILTEGYTKSHILCIEQVP